MPKSSTTYNDAWEKEFDFLTPGKNLFYAHCTMCNAEIKIQSGGIADVKRHVKSKKHSQHESKPGDTASQNEGNESFPTATDANNNLVIKLTPNDEVLKAETLQALKVVNSNYSFASCADDGDRFREMFPDSQIAKKYHQSKTKVSYIIKHGISPYVKDFYVNDFKDSPFVFKFDETTTLQVKKQYDGYVQYWSNEQDLVTSVYCGSLFVGHCFTNDLLHHFAYFGEELKWKPDLLLQIGMDGPNVNLKFEEDLAMQISNDYGVSFLKVGSCSLHQTHNAFRKGILSFGFDIENFVSDTNFFFKSASRREDYDLMTTFTEIETKYAMKHVRSRWLSIKKPVLRILDQYDNLNEYFLKFLPKDKIFTSQIKTNPRYVRIVDFLKKPTSKAELCFIAFVSTEFEGYLTAMQANKPLIHTMHERISTLVYNLMKKFVAEKAITESVDGKLRTKSGSKLAEVDVTKNQLKLEQIDVGTRASAIINSFDINSDKKESFRKKCLSFYVSSTNYLVSKLPLSNKILKDAQYLHPQKRNSSSSQNAVVRLCSIIAYNMKNHLQNIFNVPENTTVSEVCDLIKNQWQVYQLQDIPKEWHTVETDSAKKERIHQESYWKAVEKSWVDLTPKESEESAIRIDSYWSRVFKMQNSDGRCLFPQLAALVKIILTLSHGNAGPEQGFSINKAIIDVHGTRLGEEMLIALRRVKHRILQLGGIMNFKITPSLLESVKASRGRYEAELAALSNLENAQSKDQERHKEIKIQEIEDEIRNIRRGIEVAEKAISDGSNKLQEHLKAKKLDVEKLQSDNSLIQMGMERKKRLAVELQEMESKKEKLILKKKIVPLKRQKRN